MRPTITFITPNYDESSPPEGARQGHVQRTLRTTTENAERESGIDHQRSCGNHRYFEVDNSILGKWHILADPRKIIGTRQSIRCKTPHALAGKIIFKKNQNSGFSLLTKPKFWFILSFVTFAVRQDNNQDTPYSRFSLPRTSQFGSGRRFFLCSGQDVRNFSARMSATPFLRIHLP